jgi:hypothetical protein
MQACAYLYSKTYSAIYSTHCTFHHNILNTYKNRKVVENTGLKYYSSFIKSNSLVVSIPLQRERNLNWATRDKISQSFRWNKRDSRNYRLGLWFVTAKQKPTYSIFVL